MPALLIRFPAGRYHATPWGHHVNEGLIEWPPSPWRILRALIATGYAKLGWPKEAPPPLAKDLLNKLADVLPDYVLPPASAAHSRHYMPLGVLENGREKTTLVFDTWAQVADADLVVQWDVGLNREESELLATLAENLGYLGRAESWTNAAAVIEGDRIGSGLATTPCGTNDHRGPGWEQVALLAPIPAREYSIWRAEMLTTALAAAGLAQTQPSGKQSKADQKKAVELESSYPTDLIACMQAETGWLRDRGWSQPPGSRKVIYWRPADALDVGAPASTASREALPAEVMLLALATQSGNAHALPHVTRTLPQAERVHRALVSQASKIEQHSVVLTGLDAERRSPLTGRHEHAHVLPVDLDQDGHIDHFILWAPMGLDGRAQRAVRAVRQTFGKKIPDPLRLAVAGVGALRDLLALPQPEGRTLRRLIGAHRVWRSATPFVPPRYLKKAGRNTVEGQVIAELESRGRPRPTVVELIDPRDPGSLEFRHFVRSRKHGPPPPSDSGFILQIEFDTEVEGLLTLGYGSHFGLGLFIGTD